MQDQEIVVKLSDPNIVLWSIRNPDPPDEAELDLMKRISLLVGAWEKEQAGDSPQRPEPDDLTDVPFG